MHAPCHIKIDFFSSIYTCNANPRLAILGGLKRKFDLQERLDFGLAKDDQFRVRCKALARGIFCGFLADFQIRIARNGFDCCNIAIALIDWVVSAIACCDGNQPLTLR